jgi:predicted SAM-dependent methyltransferase
VALRKVKVRIIAKIPRCPTPVGRTRMVTEQLADEWIKAGYAEEVNKPWSRESSDMVPLRRICGCGFVGKHLEEMKEHQLTCRRTKTLKLHIGCGNDIREGFVNIDCRKLKGVDLVIDAGELATRFDKSTVNYILANDVIEHFPQAKAKHVLRSWVELLMPGGTIEICCPDVAYAAEISYSDEWLIRLLYGDQDYKENYHQSGYTLATMTKMLENLGLTMMFIEQTKSGNLHVKAVR